MWIFYAFLEDFSQKKLTSLTDFSKEVSQKVFFRIHLCKGFHFRNNDAILLHKALDLKKKNYTTN